MSEGRRRKRDSLTGKVIVGALGVIVGALVLYGCIDEGIGRWQITQGKGKPGVFTLDRRVYHTSGKLSGVWDWHGTFRSNDGTVVTYGEIETLPGEGSKRISTGGWNKGDKVRAQWISRTPDDIYLPKTRTFRWWVESVVFGVVCVAIGIAIWIGVRRHRRLHPDEPLLERELVSEPPKPPEPSEREIQQARLREIRADLDDLKQRGRAVVPEHTDATGGEGPT